MLRKTIFLFVLLLVLVLVFPTTGAADDGVVIVSPWYDHPTFNVTTDDFIKVRTSWRAGTPGLVQFYIQKVHQELFVNGILVVASPEARQYWGPIAPDTSPCVPEECWNTNVPRSSSVWRYPLGKLPVGTYAVVYHSWVDGPVFDLGDWDGDGHPDVVGGFEVQLYATIIVAERSPE